MHGPSVSASDVGELNAEKVVALLQSRSDGLTGAEVEARRRVHGRNALQRVARPHLMRKLAANFTHVMAVLLWVAGAAALIAQIPQLAIAIWTVNVINGAFSFWQEYRAEQAIEALRRLLPSQARVVRDGVEMEVTAEELVPGDMLVLVEGERISADARLLDDFELRVDQSTLTGESRPVSKRAVPSGEGVALVDRPSLVFAGTSVISGRATAVVFATGMATEFGRIAHLTQSISEGPSPLQLEMRHVTRTVTTIAVLVGAAFFAVGVLWTGMAPASGFIFGLGMVVAFVPEGLLPVTTLALALGVRRMARRNALVKQLSAVETLGCTTVICTDKTGTLTQNEMTVCTLWAGGRDLDADDAGGREVLRAASLCNDARLISARRALGDPTEAALKVAAARCGLDDVHERRAWPRCGDIPFDAVRKRMTTLHRTEGSVVACVKGAPSELLELCTRILLNGDDVPLSEAWRRRGAEAIDRLARDGLRVLAVARRRLASDLPVASLHDAGKIERDLTLLGLVAMHDPPRPEIAGAIEKCHAAGIRVIMITGDYGLTAESIAARVGLVEQGRARLISGQDLSTMDEAALAEVLRRDVIFARVSPEHKLRVVRCLQGMGHVVAVTGDGVNDAPALKMADIGVAMGGGTDVAREAAQLVLTDDNFASIVNAVEEGRAVYANIKRFVSYIFTSNATEAVPFVVFALSGGRIPLALQVMEILSIDLGTDLMPALALGAEPPEADVMSRPPRARSAHLISPGLLIRAYLIQGGVQATLAMSAFFFYFWTHGYWGQWFGLPAAGPVYAAATAMTLASIVATQVGNLMAQRAERVSILRLDPFSNPLIWVGILTQIIFIVSLVYVPFCQGIFGTASFEPIFWLYLLALTPALLVVSEIRKWFLRFKSRH